MHCTTYIADDVMGSIVPRLSGYLCGPPSTETPDLSKPCSTGIGELNQYYWGEGLNMSHNYVKGVMWERGNIAGE